MLFGGDEFYLDLNGYVIDAGRNFSPTEIRSSANVCVLGNDVAAKLFPQNAAMAVGKMVRINNLPFRVLGVLVAKGSSFGMSRDNIVIAGYRNLSKYFGAKNYTLGVKAFNVNAVEASMSEAEGLFRSIRKLSATEESNFVLERSNSIAEKAMSVLGFLTAAVIIIGLITLIGSAIGLMNIMLVSVVERTKEVGLVKAIGGKSSSVRLQFLLESVLISIAGAVVGIFLGVLIGNLFSLVLGTGFVVPWKWVIYGVLICTVVGLLAGLYPAVKAGKLNPIEALRYE
ncbi:MAG: ABC transporter permease [Bacteroidota bacterium]